ncbi:MAG: ATP-binding cassette subfamily C (CFTR/MRP) protein 1 [Bacillariaceae sp.]|jgi:ABC-type multidrug transport system fused ATPase/permease subunit
MNRLLFKIRFCFVLYCLHFDFPTIAPPCSTIRAFEAEPALLDRVKVLVDKQIHASYLFKIGKCWLGVRLEFVGSVLIFFGCLSFVLKKQTIVEEDELQSSANYSGMALTYLLTISSALLYTVRSSSDFEADMVSVERIRQYTDLEKEAPHDIPADKLMGKGWPSRGLVEFKDVKLRYRTETPLVLKGLNFTVPSQSRVGIVGRTGAGKSTIVNALTRLNELDSGKIILDGVDIKTIGLTKLRSNIAVIPQDPVLFSGTVKTNLDPFNQHSEGKLMDVLGRVGLYTSTDSSCAIKSLDDTVEVDGNNFSSGQRQLLVIARALLDGASVVICDEATVSLVFYDIVVAFAGKPYVFHYVSYSIA